jgi:ZIP family zinc transporter
MSSIILGFGASLVAGLLTGIGAFPVLFGSTVSRRLNWVLQLA